MRRIATMSELAECAGHMGYSSHDYPGCPERERLNQEQRRLHQEQIEMEFDAANKD